jgi:DNA-binding transcriptional LysR family regulator
MVQDQSIDAGDTFKAVTLGQLRTFLTVAETGSVRAAAQKLVVTQPSVSASLTALQGEVGVPLFAREGRGLRLTAAGTAFARDIARVLGLLDQAVAGVSGHAEPEKGRVRLAAVTTAGERLIPAALASFHERYPDADVLLEVGNRQQVWSLLTNHAVDLVIAGRPPAGAPFQALASLAHRLVLVAPPQPGCRQPARTHQPAPTNQPARTHQPAPTKPVSIADLGRQTWLLREAGSGTRAATDELLRALDLSPSTLTLGSNGAVVNGVLAGLGITLISDDAVADHLAQGTLEEWPCPSGPIEREWQIVAHADQDLVPTAALFLRHITGDASLPRRFQLTAAGQGTTTVTVVP